MITSLLGKENQIAHQWATTLSGDAVNKANDAAVILFRSL